MATNTMVALQTQVLSSATPSVTFTSIPQGYTDLVLVANYIPSATGQAFSLRVGNGSIDTGTNYSHTILDAWGTSSVGSTRATNVTYAQLGYWQVGTGTAPNTAFINIQNYSNTTTYKTFLARVNAPDAEMTASVGTWRNTAAINTISVGNNFSGNAFATGSTFTLYGIAAQPVWAAKATGGTIYSDVQYTYHVFTGSGTFTPSTNLTCDYVLVGAGGGGGSRNGNAGGAGGGGAGGYRSTIGTSGGGASAESAIALASGTGYAITIGAGGAGGAGGSENNGSVGAASSIIGGAISLTANGGGGGQGSTTAPTSGGSGGGARSRSGINGAAGTANQGYAGGGDPTASYDGGGGGGGAASIGANPTSTAGAAGGSGISATTYTTATTYAVGGNGGTYPGSGGGGTAGASGAANTGNGGNGSGSGSSGNYYGGTGGSGIVIIRYAN